MSLAIDPAAVAADVAEMGLDGWLITDFRGTNPVASRALGLKHAFLTRRWALWLPVDGAPIFLVNAIEAQSLPDLGVKMVKYAGFPAWKQHLEGLVGNKAIALEWYPNGEIPYLSRVDGGQVDLLRTLGCTLQPSARLSQKHLVLWTPRQLASHRRAARALTDIVHTTFDRIRDTPAGTIDEATVQGWIMEAFDQGGLITDHAPIVGVDAHAGDPHYVPRAEGSSVLGDQFVLLIDLWAGFPGTDCAFADITWMARRGDVSDEIEHGFQAVLAARDAGVEALKTAWNEDEELLPGFTVDDAVRAVITEAGLGDAFIHRTGHSLGTTSAHGDGANLDGYEAHDTRPVEPGLAVTIEPGVYFPTWGIRSEINVVMDPGPIVTTPPQTEWVVV